MSNYICPNTWCQHPCGGQFKSMRGLRYHLYHFCPSQPPAGNITSKTSLSNSKNEEISTSDKLQFCGDLGLDVNQHSITEINVSEGDEISDERSCLSDDVGVHVSETNNESDVVNEENKNQVIEWLPPAEAHTSGTFKNDFASIPRFSTLNPSPYSKEKKHLLYL